MGISTTEQIRSAVLLKWIGFGSIASLNTNTVVSKLADTWAINQ